MKTCNTCSAEKDGSSFNRDAGSKDGLTSRCRQCASEANKMRYQANADEIKKAVAAYAAGNAPKIAAYKADYVQKNKALIAAASAKHYLQNADSYKERARTWRTANPDRAKANHRAAQATRRSRERQAPGRYTASDVGRLLNLQRGRCACCKKKLNGQHHVDHRTPLALGGTNWPSNLELLCPNCNQRKHAKDPIVFAQQEGRLL